MFGADKTIIILLIRYLHSRQRAGLEHKIVSKTASLWVKMMVCINECYKLQKVLHCIKLLRNCILTNCINMT